MADGRLVEVTDVDSGVVSAEDVQGYRVLLEIPLRTAAATLGFTPDEYAALERGQLFFKDVDQWTKAKALLKHAASSGSTSSSRS